MLLVLFNHAGTPWMSGGYVGVDVFFVISGFLITGILVREVRQTGRVSIRTFYARRARRILPAATVVLLGIVIISSLVFSTARLREVLTHVTWAALFGANIYSARSGSDYFAEDAFVSPVQHFWSLAVEEQFYLVWPPLIALIVVTSRGRRSPKVDIRTAPSDRRTAFRLRRLTLAIALGSAMSFAWSVWHTTAAPAAAYYATVARGWELGIGALLALVAGSVSRWPPALKAVASWSGLAAVAVAALTYSTGTPFPGYHAALPVLGAALVLAGGIDGPAYGADWLLSTRPLRWFGDVSYSLYLWHWPFLLLTEHYLVRGLTPLECAVSLAAATLAAWLSFRFVETPIRRSALLTPGARSLVLWPTAVAAVLAAVMVMGASVAHPDSGAASRATDDASGSGRVGTESAVNAVGRAAQLARSRQPLPAALRPALEDLNGDVSRLPVGCGVERDDPGVSTCILGEPSAKRTIVLFGDSHVIMWLRPMERLAKISGWRIVPVQKASCFPLDATLWRSDKQRPYSECDSWRAQAYREIARIRPERIVVGGLVASVLTDPATGQPGRAAVNQRLFRDGVRSTLTRLSRLSPAVHVIGGTPQLDRTAEDCLGTRKATMATCARPVDAAVQQRNRVWQQAATAAGAHFIDPVPWLCDTTLCPLVVGNVIVYRDTNHITRTFADTLRTQLARTLLL